MGQPNILKRYYPSFDGANAAVNNVHIRCILPQDDSYQNISPVRIFPVMRYKILSHRVPRVIARILLPVTSVQPVLYFAIQACYTRASSHCPLTAQSGIQSHLPALNLIPVLNLPSPAVRIVRFTTILFREWQ